MKAVIRPGGGSALELEIPGQQVTSEQFLAFCRANRDLRLERSAAGELIVMSPTGGETGRRNAYLTTRLSLWAREHGGGAAFDSNTGFALPNCAIRAPDAAWVSRRRLEELTSEEIQGFLPLCPDFVCDLCSASDSIEPLHQKMEEYLSQGARLGWLIDPVERQVFIYRPGRRPERLQRPASVSGGPVLPGFILDLEEIWRRGL